MEQGYLIDTKAVIDYLDNKLPDKSASLIDGIIAQISVITRVELLGWTNGTTEQIVVLQQFVNASVVFNTMGKYEIVQIYSVNSSEVEN